jgi:hypothetical protein
MERAIDERQLPRIRVVVEFPDDVMTATPMADANTGDNSEGHDSAPISSDHPPFEDEAPAVEQLPAIAVSVESILLASPSHPTSYLPLAPVPTGDQVRVVGTDPDGAWLLVLYGTTMGWIPSFYSTSGISTLELVVIEPFSETCTSYLGATTSSEESWLSPVSGNIIVQGTLYRPQPEGPPEEASVALEVEGQGQVTDSKVNHMPLGTAGELVLFTVVVEGVQPDSQFEFQWINIGEDEPFAVQTAFLSSICPYPFDNSTDAGLITGVITSSELNMRSGPGVEYDPPVGILRGGEKVTILGYSTSMDGVKWWQARSPSGELGWVNSDYVEESGCVECVPEVPKPPLLPLP